MNASAITVVRRYKCFEVINRPQHPYKMNRLPETLQSRVTQTGFLQVCGSSKLQEMLIISDQLSSFKSYKVLCNCQYCVSFTFAMEDERNSSIEKEMSTEPFMNAANVVFNTLAKFNYTLQSTSSMQNSDGSNSNTWVWVRKK